MKHDLSSVRRNGDRGILEELLRRDDPLTEPRHTLVFFHVLKDEARPAEIVLNPLALRATQNGWRVAGMDSTGVIIETERSADPNSVNAMSSLMEAWAEEFGVEYDGWECAVCAEGK